MSALPTSLETATEHQQPARVALAAGLQNPTHAYLFTGPPGSGKRAAARAFVAELLVAGAPDADSARRRALADPSPHPDLAWLRPAGAQHLVEEVRERVIEAAPYRPFEGERRAFVIDEADAMAEESQNALLKTLEEPAPFAHLVLIASQPSALLDTVRSRCQEVRFAALGPEAVAERLAESQPGLEPLELRAAARLAGGDLVRAELLVSERGRELRSAAEQFARAVRAAELDAAPWRALLDAADRRGAEVGDAAKARLDALADQARDAADRRAEQRLRKEAVDAAKRAGRRGRTDALDAGLALIGAWLRDLAAAADGAPELVADRRSRGRAARRRGGARSAPGSPGRGARDGHAPAADGERERGAGPRSTGIPPGIRDAAGLSAWK